MIGVRYGPEAPLKCMRRRLDFAQAGSVAAIQRRIPILPDIVGKFLSIAGLINAGGVDAK
jgi:hypothetical protein